MHKISLQNDLNVLLSLVLRVYTMTTWTQFLVGTEDQDITKYLQTTSGIIYGFIGLVQTIKFLRWDKYQKIKSFVLLDISLLSTSNIVIPQYYRR